MSRKKLGLYLSLDEWLSHHFQFRKNVITNALEYRELEGGSEGWQKVTDYFINTMMWDIARDEEKGFDVTSGLLKEFLNSSYSVEVDPVIEYFETLDSKVVSDPVEELQRLSHCVEVVGEGSELWEEYFKRWMIATVANLFEEDKCCNHQCLVLVGGQGTGKTSFFNQLLPKRLLQYRYIGQFDPLNKDRHMHMAENIIICIDDHIDKLNQKSQGELKECITAPKVKYRRPYGTVIDDYPHRASFCATVNHRDYLADPSGSRRYWTFEVVGVDLDKLGAIDLEAAWFRAYQLYMKGYRYWMNAEEQAMFEEISSNYVDETIEMQLVRKYLRVPEPDEPVENVITYMNATEVMDYLQKWTSFSRLDKQAVGAAMNRLGFVNKTKKRPGDKYSLKRYAVIQLSQNEMELDSRESGDPDFDSSRVVHLYQHG